MNKNKENYLKSSRSEYLTCEEVIDICKKHKINTLYLYNIFYKENKKNFSKKIPRSPAFFFADEGFYYKCGFVDFPVFNDKQWDDIRAWKEENSYNKYKDFLNAWITLDEGPVKGYMHYLDVRRKNLHLRFPENPSMISDFPGWEQFKKDTA